MKLNRNGTLWDRKNRNKTNENWDMIEHDYNNVVSNISEQAYREVVDSARIEWLSPVPTFPDLSSTYPDATEGDTAMVRDTGIVYRFDGVEWSEIQEIDATPVNEVDTRLSNQMGDLSAFRSWENNIISKMQGEFEERGVNVKWFGASGSDKTTTGSIASGSDQLTVSDAIDFKVGQGIAIEGAGVGGIAEVAELQITSSPSTDGEVIVTLDGVTTNIPVDNGMVESASLEITSAPTTAGNIIVTLDGVSTSIAVDPSVETSAEMVMDKIRNTTFSGWATGGGTTNVTFTATDEGTRTDATYSENGTGATGTMTTTTQGVNPETPSEVAANIRATSFSGWSTSGTGDTVIFTSDSTGARTDTKFDGNGTGVVGNVSTTTQGANGGLFVSEITAIDGTTFTLADTASSDASSAKVIHDDTVSINDALFASAGKKVDFTNVRANISGRLEIQNGSKIIGKNATIEQKADHTNIFYGSGIEDVTISGFNFIGVGTDYQDVFNNDSVGIYIDGASPSKNINILGNNFEKFSRAAMSLNNIDSFTIGTNNIKGLEGFFEAETDSRNLGIFIGNDCTNGSINGKNVISHVTQGIMMNKLTKNISITDNIIHDVVGQHGMYLQSSDGLLVTGNIVGDISLQGMKIQQSETSEKEATDYIISGNTFINTGSHAVLLTNTDANNALDLYSGILNNNVIIAPGQEGVSIKDVTGLVVSGNLIKGTTSGSGGTLKTRHGIHVENSNDLTITTNNISNVKQNGVYLENTPQDNITISINDIKNPARSGVSGANYGIQMRNGSNIKLSGNKVSDDYGNMRYGIFTNADVDHKTLAVSNNTVEGAYDYSIRFDSSATEIKAFYGNSIESVLTLPKIITNRVGPTSRRPSNPYLSQPYFDTDLGYEIHYNGSSWVNGTGATV